MKQEIFKNSQESPKTTLFTPPAVESFSDPIYAASIWPEQVVQNENFLKQIEARKLLKERLNAVLDGTLKPKTSLQEAVTNNDLTEKQVADLYSSLSDLIGNNRDYERIILYLPFEFLPSQTWKPVSIELQQATEKFKTAYMKAWNNLLNTQDVRANFVDGDILDVESRTEDLPRVVKAAHLIPKMVEAGLLEIDDVFKLMESTTDPILKQSIADTLPILSDSNLSTEKITPIEFEETSLSLIQEKLRDKLEFIAGEEYTGITKKRISWLKQHKKQQAIESIGDDIKLAILNKTLSINEIVSFIKLEASTDDKQAIIEGARKAIESLAQTNVLEAQKLYNEYRELFLKLWEDGSPILHRELSKTFYHFCEFKLITDKELATLGLTLPTLGGPFSENLKSMPEELHKAQNAIESIKNNPELSKYVYPVTLLFGSRLKGYGAKDSDLDVGVFVKPNTPFTDLEKIKALLQATFSRENMPGEIMEFWLEKNGENLSIIDFEKYDSLLGESYWTHVLFGGAWQGDQNIIRELREKLLTPYLSETKKIIRDRAARGLYLEELERDTLQYRLMHRGYEQFFPAKNNFNIPSAKQIDGQSMFWDSGYRRLATKLFINRVFLPQVS